MMYEHIVSNLKETYENKKVSFIKDHFAIQFNIWGEGHGALYMELDDGNIHIEPYEYYDRDTLISTDAETLLGIASGKIDPVTYGDLYVEGNSFGLEILRDISKKDIEDQSISENKKQAEKKEKNGKKDRKKKTSKKKSVKSSNKEGNEVTKKVKEKAESAVELVKDKAESAVESVKGKFSS